MNGTQFMNRTIGPQFSYVVLLLCPPTISFDGLGETINDIRFGKERETRAQLSWKNKEIEQSVRNMEQICNSAKILNDPAVPHGFKMYAEVMYRRYMETQENLNDKMGFKNEHIDING